MTACNRCQRETHSPVTCPTCTTVTLWHCKQICTKIGITDTTTYFQHNHAYTDPVRMYNKLLDKYINQ